MSIIVTGGAGFIGSCIVKSLNDRGIEDIIVVDNINTTEKWLNLRNERYKEYVHKDQFLGMLKNDRFGHGISHIIHMGACSSTMEQDFDYLYRNNFDYSRQIWYYCVKKEVPFIYASSAATYGDGELGFDDEVDISLLQPLNRYGYSKQIFDLFVRDQSARPSQSVGLKFFNVFGPNEYAKGNMASMVFHGFHQIRKKGAVELFKSYKADVGDGQQLRDFVYVKDVCRIVLFFVDHPGLSGLFNVGTGKPKTFKNLIESIFQALGMEPQITYIDMPERLKATYQYYTKATTDKLRKIGYSSDFFSLEDAVQDYVCSYLDKGYARL